MRQNGDGMAEDLLVYEGIVATFQVASEAVKQALAAFKITPAQFGLLRRVEEDEVVSLTELARRLGCSNANMTRLVENTVKAGLVEKVQHPSDQRVAPVRLTAQGVLTRERAAVAYLRAVSRFVGQLGEEERAAFLALQSRLGSPPRLPASPASIR
jgi:DNA-binding MarR family transcriptional regulator